MSIIITNDLIHNLHDMITGRELGERFLFTLNRFVIAALAVVSLVACVIVTESNASAAFYLSHTRAWELLAGGLLAVNAIPALQDQQKREFVSLAGMMMLASSVLFFSDRTIFPGLAAVLPVLGTAMLIHSGTNGQTVISRCLSARPLVFIGLISYSLYLWHWPVVVFAQYYSVVALTPAWIGMVLFASFLLAVLSWRYVETPFREKRLAAEPRQMLRVSAAATVVLVLAGLTGMHGQEAPGPYGENPVMAFEEEDAKWLRWQACEQRSRALGEGSEPCVIGTDGQAPSFVLWGDSHATSLASGVDRSAAQNGVAGELVISSGCPPLYGVVRYGRDFCDQFNSGVLQYLAERDEITTVILAARWAYAVNGEYEKRQESYALNLVDLQSTGPGDADNAGIFEAGLRRAIGRLRELGKDVVLVGPVPEIGYDVPSATFVALKTNRDVDTLISPTVSEHRQRNEDVMAVFGSLEESMAISAILQPSDYLCDMGHCRVAIDNAPLYRDDNHLSTPGSEYLSPMFDELFGIHGPASVSSRPGTDESPELLQGATGQ